MDLICQSGTSPLTLPLEPLQPAHCLQTNADKQSQKRTACRAKYDEAKNRMELLEGQLAAARQRETEASLAAQVARQQMMRERCSRTATDERYRELERVALKAQQHKVVELNQALIRARDLRLPSIRAKT